jgi:hypothetical protein
MKQMEVGKVYINSGGNKIEVAIEVPKRVGSVKEDLLINKSIGKVFGVYFNDNPTQLAVHKKTNEFIKFTNKCYDLLDTKDFSMKFGDFEEIVLSGHQSDNGMVYKQIHFSEGVFEFIYKGVEVCLVPWNDGVMLQSIIVPNELRGSGLATSIMEDLDNISCELEIPIYLIPYPAENYNPNDELELESKLQNWYGGLDYGKANESTYRIWPKVLCNFE